MNSKLFYGARPKFKVRLPPACNSEDSELSDSDTDSNYTLPKTPVFCDSSSDSNASDSENKATCHQFHHYKTLPKSLMLVLVPALTVVSSY